MNIQIANTEPFYRFHRFNEEFNRNMRVTIGALAFVSNKAETDAADGKQMTLPTDGEPWGDETKWNDIGAVVTTSKTFVSQIAVVRVMSAFEDLLISTKAEHDRYSMFCRFNKEPVVSPDEDDIGLLKLYTQLEWGTNNIATAMPLHQFFVILRHCIVHRSGRASSSLCRTAASSALANCIKDWHSDIDKSLPTLPTVEEGREFSLLPRHAVLANEVCYRISRDINTQLRNFLQEPGILYAAAHHSLLADDPVMWHDPAFKNAARTAQAIINLALTCRYLVSLADRDEAVSRLSKMGLWKVCLAAFDRHAPASS